MNKIQQFVNFMYPDPKKDWETPYPWWHRPVIILTGLGLVLLGGAIAIVSLMMDQRVGTLPLGAGIIIMVFGFFAAVFAAVHWGKD